MEECRACLRSCVLEWYGNLILNRSYLSPDSESGDVGLERRVPSPEWAVYLIYDEKGPVTVVG